MKTTICVLVLALSLAFVAADGAKPTWWFNQGPWWSSVNPYNPIRRPSIFDPLVLKETNVVVKPTSSAGVVSGTMALYFAGVTCPAAANPSDVIGDCALTGQYLVSIPAGSTDKAVQKVNWYGSCVLTKPCGAYGVGSISFAGRAGGVDDQSAVDTPITGGTGAYAGFSKGGVLSYENGVYTIRFTK